MWRDDAGLFRRSSMPPTRRAMTSAEALREDGHTRGCLNPIPPLAGNLEHTPLPDEIGLGAGNKAPERQGRLE